MANLEKMIGAEKMQAFLKDYLAQNDKKSVTTKDF
jgi:aminopeptidase N